MKKSLTAIEAHAKSSSFQNRIEAQWASVLKRGLLEKSPTIPRNLSKPQPFELILLI